MAFVKIIGISAWKLSHHSVIIYVMSTDVNIFIMNTWPPDAVGFERKVRARIWIE